MRLLLDGGCFVGHDPFLGRSRDVPGLLADLDRLGIDRALVGNLRSLFHDLKEGNAEMARWAGLHPERILPLGLVHPAYYGESPQELLGWLKHGLGFRAVGLFSDPAYYPVRWNAPAVRAIGLAASGLGLVLVAGVCTESDLAGVAEAWGDLRCPVLLRWMKGHRYLALASELTLAERNGNFLFDVGNVSSAGVIRQMAARIGARRLFLATGSPYNIPLCGLAALRESGLPPEDRCLIAGGALMALFGEKGAAADGRAPWEGAWETLLMRPKVDVHWHPDHWNLGEPDLTERDQQEAFDRFGYERVVMNAITAANHDMEKGNRVVADWFERDGRVFGLIVVNPLRADRALREIERLAEHPRFVGVKITQDVFGMSLDDPGCEPLLRLARDTGLPVMAHLPGMEEAARRHPDLQFVAAHANWQRARRLIPLPNVSFDFSTGHALEPETQLRRFIQSVGPERVLFGSDAQLVSPPWSLAKLSEADLQDEELDQILRRNAYRIFRKLERRSLR